MRIWTIACAILLAGVTGLNTVTLLNSLYTNGDFRAQVVGAAPQMMELANRVLPEGPKDAATKMFTGLVAKALQDSNAKADATPTAIDSEAAGETWFKAHVPDSAQQTAAIAAFNKAFLDQRAQDAAAVRSILTKSSFDILQFRWDGQKPFWPQLPGVLASAALLSLGAPFWYNLLKQLTNLRPVLAQKQDAAAK
jgi:hypothetical protein